MQSLMEQTINYHRGVESKSISRTHFCNLAQYLCHASQGGSHSRHRAHVQELRWTEDNDFYSDIYTTATQSTWGHSVQLAHAVLTTPWMSLLLWGCSWLWAGLRVNRACPDSAMLLQTVFFWPNLAGVTTTWPPVPKMYLKCVSDQHVILDTYHACVNLFQFHCIEHWHMQKEKNAIMML